MCELLGSSNPHLSQSDTIKIWALALLSDLESVGLVDYSTLVCILLKIDRLGLVARFCPST